MPRKIPTTPALSSSFALIDIKRNRRKLAKIVADGHRIPFTISGYISGVGNDDGVSIEFTADVEVAGFGQPKLG
jgi:hypothetical protein